ncbi:DUF2786 domain-containing protein [Desulfosudis oleivorans]|uniref:DUF2786 domain-containing protein n=1 Tax=Desulfosudis oleivorans (strain DSM 6200 / JCM 39069 / Hxd3) TaxID=96561 RepID=A8ZZL9_DESOH|nr:DUF2786 domain-containing protein [Desulfosudis oleivorans]ABW68891.1 hypothetical protein Dole_3088 [Desulfosudis oleivorans Hxd3]
MNNSDDTRYQLYGAWNRHLYQWWDYYNSLYLKGGLKRPVIRLSSLKAVLGQWDAANRTLTLSLFHIEADDWFRVMDTLRHEMAHQYVDEVLRPVGESAHGPAFKAACQKLRCGHKSSDQGVPQEEGRALRRLKKVLSLAASPNENEAQLAMQKARELMLKYNLDRVALDCERDFFSRTLGTIKARHTSAELRMASLLGRFFFVEVLWQHTYDALQDKAGTVLMVYGTPSSLEMAHYVYDYLWMVMEALWTQYRTVNKVPGHQQRQRYFAGVLDGFYRKLEKQERAIQEIQALVWQGDPRLTGYYRYLNPRIRTCYGGGVHATGVYHAGVNDGRKVTLHKPIQEKKSSHGGYIARE